MYDEDDPNLLTADQLASLVGAMPERWRAGVLLMVSTGLRWGELSGLRWDDINEAAGCVRVRRTNWKGIAVAPKTKGSKRTVPLEPEVAVELRAHRARLLRTQNPGLAAGWVFPTQKGGLHRGYPMLRALDKALVAAALVVDMNVHGLRRTFNNIARPLVSREVLKSITGHTTDRMVEGYSVVSLNEKRAAAAGVLAAAQVPRVVPKVVEEKPAGA